MLSRNAASGSTEYRAVKETFQTQAKPLFALTLQHADGSSEQLTLTGDHPFRVLGEAANDPAWVNSGELSPGQQVETQAGTAQVIELKPLNRQAVTYNIEVEGNHTYFVGQQPTLVHNCSCKVNLNRNDATSNFGVYEIRTPDGLEKVGKADLDRVTQSTNLPTRVHQQVRQLEKTHGEGNVKPKIVEELGVTTTAAAKAAEKARLDRIYQETNSVSPGNRKSYRP